MYIITRRGPRHPGPAGAPPDPPPGATLWVNTSTGDDARSKATVAGSGGALPWASVARAVWGSTNRAAQNASEAASAGDVVSVAAGIYGTTATDLGSSLTPWYNPANSGTSPSPIKFIASGTVTLTNNGAGCPLIGCDTKDYIWWDGFTVTEAGAPSTPDTGQAVLTTTTGSRITRCTLTGSGNMIRGDNYAGVFCAAAHGGSIDRNILTGYKGDMGQNMAGVLTYYSSGLTIEHNRIDNCGCGVFRKADFGAPDAVDYIRFNWISGCEDAGIMVHRAPKTSGARGYITQNLIQDCVDVVNSAGLKAMQFLGDDVGDGTDPTHWYWFNNTVDNCSIGMYWLYAPVSGADLRCFNTIIANMDWGQYYEFGNTYVVTSRVNTQHNVFYNCATVSETGSGAYTTLANWTSARPDYDTVTPASVSTNPNFVNPAADNYHLDTGSSADNLGVDVLDLDGDSDTADLIDAGCYVTGSETIGVT